MTMAVNEYPVRAVGRILAWYVVLVAWATTATAQPLLPTVTNTPTAAPSATATAKAGMMRVLLHGSELRFRAETPQAVVRVPTIEARVRAATPGLRVTAETPALRIRVRGDQ